MPKEKEFGALNRSHCIRLRHLRVNKLLRSSSLRHGKRVPTKSRQWCQKVSIGTGTVRWAQPSSGIMCSVTLISMQDWARMLFLCKSRGDSKEREPNFLMQNFSRSPVSSSPRRKLTGVFLSVFLNWYVLLKWLPCSYVQTNKKSLPGKNLSSKVLELCNLSPLLIKIVKNLEAVCKPKIITDPVTRATVIQAIASSRSSWHSPTTKSFTPKRKVLELPSILHKHFRHWWWTYKSSAEFMDKMWKEIFTHLKTNLETGSISQEVAPPSLKKQRELIKAESLNFVTESTIFTVPNDSHFI